jgi:Fe2+ transport system protein FeoA
MSWARVKEVKSQSPDTVARLAGMCILPGVVFQLRQRQPAFVLRVDETMLALDRLLAEWIWVEPIGDLPTGDLDISAHQREDILLQPSITVSRLNGRNTKPH